ncbi:MAG: PorT family protein [Bacteroidia bacterium]|nr:PorT family protein [Bacteroidia bacterium]
MRYIFPKLFLAALVSCFLFNPSFGQKIDPGIDLPEGLRLGGKAGFTAAKIVGGVNTYFAPRFFLGVWGSYPSPFLDEMEFRAEILLSAQGANDATRREARGRWSYTYVSIPLIASFKPFETEKLRVDAGLQPNYLIRARYRDQNEVFVISQETRNLDIALVLGGAYDFKEEWFAEGRIILSLYNHSLRDWSDDRYLNQSVQLGVGKWLSGE